MGVAQKVHCRVERIVDHGEHVYTVDLVPDKRVPAFKPGQFLHLALDAYDPCGFWPESRPFSIASAPSRRERLRVTYSVQGQFTARMEKELAEGKSIWVKLPYGEFVIQDTSDIVLFAGGTGITAFTAFLDALTATFPKTVYLAYGARNARLLIDRDWVDRRAATVPQLRSSYFIENDTNGASASRSETIGRPSAAAIWRLIENPLEATYYISGPPPMLKAISRELGDRGVGADAIRIDAWG
jgi:ferredoxin-NADP reductase